MDKKERETQSCRTLRVEDCAEILGVSRSTAYNLVNQAERKGEPFRVVRFGGSGSNLRVSKKSFEEFLDSLGL